MSASAERVGAAWMMRRRARAKPSAMRGVPTGVPALTPAPIGAAGRGWGGTLVNSAVGGADGVGEEATGAVGVGKTTRTGELQAARSATAAPPRAQRAPRRNTARRVSIIPPRARRACAILGPARSIWSPRAGTRQFLN